MKHQLAFCITAAALICLAVCLHAAPPRWAETLKAEKPLDIWSDCSGPNAKAQLRNVTIIPDPPRKGSSVNVTAEVILLEDVTKGKVKVLATLEGFPFPFLNKVYDLCDLLKEVGKACPIRKGPYAVGPLSTQIPNYVPSGTYSGHVDVTDQNGNQVYCLKVSLKL